MGPLLIKLQAYIFHMKANANKYHLLVSSVESRTAKIEDFNIKNSTKEKLLGVNFDSNVSFESHVTSPEVTRSCKNITLHGLK